MSHYSLFPNASHVVPPLFPFELHINHPPPLLFYFLFSFSIPHLVLSSSLTRFSLNLTRKSLAPNLHYHLKEIKFSSRTRLRIHWGVTSTQVWAPSTLGSRFFCFQVRDMWYGFLVSYEVIYKSYYALKGFGKKCFIQACFNKYIFVSIWNSKYIIEVYWN